MSENLNKLLFFNIETAGITSNLVELEREYPLLYDSWENNVLQYIRKWFTEDEDLSSEEIFIKRAAGIPEFARIVCISAAFLQADNKPKVESHYNLNEKEIITKFKDLVERIDGLGFKICGHEIKSFSIPCIAKRMLINGIKPPKIFPSHDTKPWEIRAIDTKDVWGFASGRGLYSLDVISASMGLKKEKKGNTISSEETHKLYWQSENTGDWEVIKDKCEEDLLDVMRLMLKIKLLK